MGKKLYSKSEIARIEKFQSEFFRATCQTPESVHALLELTMTPQQIDTFEIDTLEVLEYNPRGEKNLTGYIPDIHAKVQLKDSGNAFAHLLIDVRASDKGELKPSQANYMKDLYRDGVAIVIPVIVLNGPPADQILPDSD